MNLKVGRRADRLSGFLLVGMAMVLATSQAAQAKPNFSGEWKLNASKSEFSPMPAPEKRTDKIVHADPKLTVTTTQTSQAGEGTFEQKYSTDGEETTNELRGAPVKSTAKWDGEALMITTKAVFNGMDITLSDKWSLSEDGKVLTVGRHIKAPQGEFDQKLVMEKQ
jgi:hypothetical protein